MRANDRVLGTGMAVLAALCGGCSGGAGEAGELAAADRLTVPNGIELNGIELNGIKFNGVDFNGVRFNGVDLDPVPLAGMTLGAAALTGVSLAGASLSATLTGGAVVSAGGLVGAELPGTLSNGVAVTLRIDGVATGSAADVLLYTVSASVAGGSGFQPLCGSDGGGAPVQAIPLHGSWDASAGTATGGAHVDDATTITFACEGYALAKCVDFGYAPWRTVSECNGTSSCANRSLASFHQACTRLLRADYCGDGTSTTRDGTQVDLWDDFAIQTDDAPTWSLEAEWSPDGAVCVDETRWAKLTDGSDVATYVRNHCSGRWQTPGCGGTGSTFFTANGFATPLDQRSLLRDRIPDQQ
jgi:hypothetical protein